MKKLIFVLCALLALTFTTAWAEEESLGAEVGIETVETVVDSKVTLWEHLMITVDPEGNETEEMIKVTLEPKTPVTLERIVFDEVKAQELYMAGISRDGVASLVVSVSAANMGPHYNLNDYTDEMLQEYIAAIVADNYAEDAYTADVLKSEGGNTFVAISDEYTYSISTIYDDFVMEIYQFNIDVDTLEFQPITEEDKAFAIEIFQSIWTE